MRGKLLSALALILMLGGVGQAIAQARKPPYYASINASEARMRTGPGRNYPVSWLYLRSGLPIKVVAVYESWRKVRDPDGAEGWMQANLLTEARTAMVIGDDIQVMRQSPDPSARVSWRVEPKVIGRVSKCRDGWCRLDVRGRAGFIEVRNLWGVEPGERVE
jgi:SH3-like domain-containing protein